MKLKNLHPWTINYYIVIIKKMEFYNVMSNSHPESFFSTNDNIQDE
jgi:hypothetical protein